MTDDKAPERAITDFLNELDERESLLALKSAFTQKSVLYFRTDAAEKVIAAAIDSFIDKRVILKLENPDISITINVEVSIKFNVGTEVFFVKTPIKSYLGSLCFDLTSKVIQLKRRKEPRLLVPKKYTQSAAILSQVAGVRPILCTVIDISSYGMRLEVKNLMQIQVKRDDMIKIQFQIHRRAEVQCEARVRFFMNRQNHGTLLGLEMVYTKDIQRERVSGIVDDIVSFQNGQKF